MPSPVCIILSPVFWKIGMMCDFPTEDTQLDTWTGYTTKHMCALVTLRAGLFLVVTLKKHTLQRHHPTLAAWQLPRSRRVRGRGTILMAQGGTPPISMPIQQRSELLTTLVVKTTVVSGEGWRGRRSHSTGRRQRN